MTVSSPTNRATYTGNGVTVAFAFTPGVYDEADLKVYLDSVLQTSGYTVTGTIPASSTVTFDTAPAADVVVLLKRQVDYTQETDYSNFDGNPSDVTEKQLDLNVMMVQQLVDGVDRSLKLRESDPTTSIELPLVADRANKFLAFDSLGNPTASSGATSSGTTFGATGEDLAATATPALARAVLELGDLALEDTVNNALWSGTPLSLANGGTGQSTPPLAFAALKQDATTDATGVVELATTAETLAGTDDTRALTAAGVAGTKSLATNGYYSLPGGFTVQWGLYTGGADSGTVTFPVAFTTACYCVTTAQTTGNNDVQAGITGLTTANFTFNHVGANTENFYWMAVGQ